MGAKYWYLVGSDGDARERLATRPVPDADASFELAQRLFGDSAAVANGTGSLEMLDPRGNEVLVGAYPGVRIAAAEAFAIDKPSSLPERFLEALGGSRITLHLQHSVVDWAAFAVWEDGVLRRAFSADADNGVTEDVGERYEFEQVFWSPDPEYLDPESEDPYGHPLDMGEAANLHFNGFQFEGVVSQWLFEPAEVSIPAFTQVQKKPFWKFW